MGVLLTGAAVAEAIDRLDGLDVIVRRRLEQTGVRLPAS
jgi:hypothetical protein